MAPEPFLTEDDRRTLNILKDYLTSDAVIYLRTEWGQIDSSKEWLSHQKTWSTHAWALLLALLSMALFARPLDETWTVLNILAYVVVGLHLLLAGGMIVNILYLWDGWRDTNLRKDELGNFALQRRHAWHFFPYTHWEGISDTASGFLVLIGVYQFPLVSAALFASMMMNHLYNQHVRRHYPKVIDDLCSR